MANLILILGDQVSQWHKALGLNVEIRPDTITTEVIELVNEHFSEHFGTTDDFHYAVTGRILPTIHA
ncbi:cryptochrome/photolyase family protein [uncultured Marinobacter sp.]|uniref:cryptochrome/photolyase family protein n=1 Tax=uncultured Marinobacter sp. TaxID=187379 RepID=UPI00258CFE66|nr:cryptochrome/photolyase family protein [uncultured Marinobacter sp.]